MEQKTQRPLTVFLGMLLFVIMLFSALFMTGCSQRIEDYTEEQHEQRISERMGKRIKEWTYDFGEKHYDGFNVYPLYDEKENLVFFLVELEPRSFVFVKLFDEKSALSRWLFGGEMYRYNVFTSWSPYESATKISSEENDVETVYKRSPYYQTNNINNRKYLIQKEEDEYICAVKNDVAFVNLISGKEFDVDNEEMLKTQSTLRIVYYPGKSFDL